MENFPNYAGYGQTPTVCVNHPNRVSYAQCKRCNRTVCGECQVALDVGMVCPDCDRELKSGSSKAKGSFLARHWHITSRAAARRRKVRKHRAHSWRATGTLRTRSF